MSQNLGAESQQADSFDAEIGIVGRSPTGLTIANLLGRLGVKSILITHEGADHRAKGGFDDDDPAASIIVIGAGRFSAS